MKKLAFNIVLGFLFSQGLVFSPGEAAVELSAVGPDRPLTIRELKMDEEMRKLVLKKSEGKSDGRLTPRELKMEEEMRKLASKKSDLKSGGRLTPRELKMEEEMRKLASKKSEAQSGGQLTARELKMEEEMRKLASKKSEAQSGGRQEMAWRKFYVDKEFRQLSQPTNDEPFFFTLKRLTTLRCCRSLTRMN